MATPKPTNEPDDSTIQQLEEEVQAHERRLRLGEGMVREEKEKGGDHEKIDRLETHWINLLRHYELLYDRLQRQLAARRVMSDGRLMSDGRVMSDE